MFRKIGNAIRRFMYGRYGSDQLNLTLLVTAVALSLLNSLLSVFLYESTAFTRVISPSLYLLMLVLLGLSLARCFSRNIYKRRQENQRFRSFFARICDRQHRYFRCPTCKQRVRVPRGKGKLNIRCPKCGNRFLRKT